MTDATDPDVVYSYNPDKNPASASLPGIPLRDLTTDDLENLAEQAVRSIEASGWYTRRERKVSRASGRPGAPEST